MGAIADYFIFLPQLITWQDKAQLGLAEKGFDLIKEP